MEHLKMIFELPSPSELSLRINNFKKAMEKLRIDIALIFSNVNLFYFTNSIQKGCLIIPTSQRPLYLVQKDLERAKAETCPEVIDLFKISNIKEILPYLKDIVSKEKIKIGVELKDIPASLYLNLIKLFGAKEFIDISIEILKLRSKKSKYELLQMKKAGKISDEVFSKVSDYLREGITEVEVAGLIQAEGRKLGNQEVIRMRGFNNELTNPHLLSGKSAAIPSSGDVPLSGYGTTPAIAQGASLKKILKGDPIIVDYAGGYNGYVTDETRLFVIGNLSKNLEKAYWVSREIIDFVEKNVKEGENGKDIYESILKIVDKHKLTNHFMGYGKNRARFVAHGIGLVINEFPIIAYRRDEILEENMVFSIEPKFVFPDKGAVGVEVDFIVKKNNVERLTGFPLDIVRIDPVK